ncbi:TetR/AcrR family transcriptional regulator [Streptomyces liangshanensis]|uniref:TetR/AcrR family transcriptional regulator n=1 Tax=Streptomyces liangshanensis TaxID=2717324 RepID=A0A6G9H6G8_9ACTN|nr:TetR/AcrR family transcriptional regulator [Streptomyces liangshanensis]QIQ06135.1 TetR/AcrR family transcriptional regulator [Streptomyces liangshanensis]
MAGRKQFDVDVALDRAMRVFWQQGYAGASVDLLGSATGLGRGSLYGTFGGKDALFRQCLDRYAAIYGARYERALAAHQDEPVRAMEAFLGVVLDRIADPDVPDGCLVAQSTAQSATLTEAGRARVMTLLGQQRIRVRAALAVSGADAQVVEDLSVFVVGVVQSLAVLSRAGTPDADLRAVVRLACTTVADTLARAAKRSECNGPR